MHTRSFLIDYRCVYQRILTLSVQIFAAMFPERSQKLDYTKNWSSLKWEGKTTAYVLQQTAWLTKGWNKGLKFKQHFPFRLSKGDLESRLPLKQLYGAVSLFQSEAITAALYIHWESVRWR